MNFITVCYKLITPIAVSFGYTLIIKISRRDGAFWVKQFPFVPNLIRGVKTVYPLNKKQSKVFYFGSNMICETFINGFIIQT